MLTMQNLSRPSGAPIHAGPLCPNCGRPMHLARIETRPEGQTDVHIFRCGECGVSLAEAAKRKSA